MAARSMRIEYGKHLVEMGRVYPYLVALEADLKDSTQSIQFQQAFPLRYLEIGIAEQNMMGIAAGLALESKLPVTHSFACFTSMRAYEQVRTTIAYPRLNVKMVASHGGISPGTAGTTHHAIEDIAIMRAIPNMTVLVPGDVEEMKQAVSAAFAYEGPVYIRLCAVDVPDVYEEMHTFAIGRATELCSGSDAAIVTTGAMMHEGTEAADRLRSEFGIKVRVLQMASVKPIDREALLKAAEETGHIVTVEEHNFLGGLGSAVCEVVSETGKAIVARIGINDRFSGVGSYAYLKNEEGLTADNIIKSVMRCLPRKDIR